MSKKSTKNIAFLDRFVKHWTTGSHNHPEGWAWWKRKNRRDIRHKLKQEAGDYDD